MATRTPADTRTPPEYSEAQGDPTIPPAIPPTDDAGTSRELSDTSLCFAYPCSVDSGVTYKEMLRYIKTLYNNGNKVYAKKKIIEVIPELKGVGVFPKEWNELEESFKKSEIGKYFDKVGTIPIDSTMMGQDYGMFIDFLKCSPLFSHFIKDDRDTHIQDISSFLQRKPNEKEVRILCIIGHGISEEQAKLLKENPPAFDNDQCTDTSTSKMKSCRWKWPLMNCNDREGLGKGYTAKSVCKDARKGDIVVFASGFLTPEWIVEQLRKRELNNFIGKIPFTLVLLVDSCYSGEWTKRIEELGGFQNTRLVVQTSCAADEGSYGQCFIPYWCAMQNENVQGDQKFCDETLNCKQTPTLYDSDYKHGNGVGVLKFFPHGQSLQYNNFNYTVERGAHRDFINRFSQGEGTIHSYKLKHHDRSGNPMAFFLVEINHRMIHLHVHFDNFNDFIVTAVNSYETKKLTANRYKCGKVGTKVEEYDKETLSGISNQCKKLVGHDQWYDEQSWTMKNTQPPFEIRSRSVMFELLNPHKLEISS